ncbi:MAG: hypothetical protein ISS31_00675 [Kiritimatiellae bacterium]|nr:hypothetical protein [Kiritimatiellia bacterium]
MDLGIFRRRKATFWAWIVLPALTVIVVYNALDVYCTSVEDQLYRRKAMLGIMNDVEERMSVAKDVVCGFAVMGDGHTSAAEDVSMRITELARRHRFTINSLRVKDGVETLKSASPALYIELKGEGDILSLMQFLNELQSPQHLTVIDGALMQLQRQGDKSSVTYKTELDIRCFRDALQGGDDA